jgi:hypothetical protein
MAPEGWDTAAVVSDALSAQALLGRLVAEGLPARLQTDTALLGVARQCRILVPTRLLLRARWLLWQTRFTDEELTELATACEPGDVEPVRATRDSTS